MKRLFPVFLTAGLLLTALPIVVLAGDVSLFATRDATLYEDPLGALANGSGDHIFAGNTAGGLSRRAVFHFDIAGAIPAGSVITFAAVTLNVTRTISGPEDVSLHRVTNDWGEGASDAPGNEGGGAAAAAGDATWLHNFYSGLLWTSPGGDFIAAPSATSTVDDIEPVVWLGPGVVADVDFMLDNPASNFGFILVGNESLPTTAKRFGSIQNPDPLVWPRIRILFDDPVPVEESTWSDLKQLY